MEFIERTLSNSMNPRQSQTLRAMDCTMPMVRIKICEKDAGPRDEARHELIQHHWGTMSNHGGELISLLNSKPGSLTHLD